MNIFVIGKRSFWYQKFFKALRLTEIEANQTEVRVSLRAEIAKNCAKANFEDLGEKHLL